jgi:hypothetical protein
MGHHLVGIGLSADVGNSLVHCIASVVVSGTRSPSRTTVNGIRLLVGDFDAELLLNSHHNLNGIQTVETKIVVEMRRAGNLFRRQYGCRGMLSSSSDRTLLGSATYAAVSHILDTVDGITSPCRNS